MFGARSSPRGDRGRAVVKAFCLESRRSRFRPPLWHSGFKETNISSPLTRQDSDIIGL